MRTLTHFVPRTPIPGESTSTFFVTMDEEGQHYGYCSDRKIPDERMVTLESAGMFVAAAKRIEVGIDCRVTVGPSGIVTASGTDPGSGGRLSVRIGRVDRAATDRSITLMHATTRGNPGGAFEVRVADVNHVTWFQDGHTEVAFRSPAAGDGFEEVACVIERAGDVIAALEGRDPAVR